MCLTDWHNTVFNRLTKHNMFNGLTQHTVERIDTTHCLTDWKNIVFNGLTQHNVFNGLIQQTVFNGLIQHNVFNGLIQHNVFNWLIQPNVFNGMTQHNKFNGVYPQTEILSFPTRLQVNTMKHTDCKVKSYWEIMLWYYNFGNLNRPVVQYTYLQKGKASLPVSIL